MGTIASMISNIAMEVVKSWSRPRILPFLALFFLYAFTRPLPYDFLHDPVVMVVIKTSSIWYLVFYVQVIKDLWRPAPASSLSPSSSSKDALSTNPDDIICVEKPLSISKASSSIVATIPSKSDSESTTIDCKLHPRNNEGEYVKNNIENDAYSVFVIDKASDTDRSVYSKENDVNNYGSLYVEQNDDELDPNIIQRAGLDCSSSDILSINTPIRRPMLMTLMKHGHGDDKAYANKKPSRMRRFYSKVRKTQAWSLLEHIINTISKKSIGLRNSSGEEEEDAYKQFFTLAFVISSMGDAFMIFPSTFIPGVLSYGSAHVLSIVGFQSRFKRPRFAWLIYPYNIIGVLSILVWIRNIQMIAIIFVYAFMLTTVMFYALSNLETRPSIQSLLATIGAAFYVWSDTMIAYDKWIFNLPFRNALIWSTYFFAQMNLALSV